MIGRRARLALVLLALSLPSTSSAGLAVYWTTDENNTHTSPPVNWNPGPPPDSLGPTDMNLWLAFRNVPDTARDKFFRILIENPGLNNFDGIIEVEGFRSFDDTDPVTSEDLGSIGNSEKYDGWWALKPQPEWERIKLTKSHGGSAPNMSWDITVNAICTDAEWALPDLKLHFASFGAPGAVTGNPLWTEVWIFPRQEGIDLSPPIFNAPPWTGSWGSTFVYTDPDGNPRPGGGVKFTSSGPGLTVSDQFYAEVRIDGGIVNLYDVYSYDPTTLEYEQYRVRTGILGAPGSNPWILMGTVLATLAAGLFGLARRRTA